MSPRLNCCLDCTFRKVQTAICLPGHKSTLSSSPAIESHFNPFAIGILPCKYLPELIFYLELQLHEWIDGSPFVWLHRSRLPASIGALCWHCTAFLLRKIVRMCCVIKSACTNRHKWEFQVFLAFVLMQMFRGKDRRNKTHNCTNVTIVLRMSEEMHTPNNHYVPMKTGEWKKGDEWRARERMNHIC